MQTLKLSSEKTKANLNVISNGDMISETKLSKKRTKLRDDILKEKEAAKNEINAFMVHNPVKVISKVIDNTYPSLQMMTVWAESG
jgi:hypothetical protein